MFSTNYDLCVESACRAEGIDVTTGFDLSNGQWRPELFDNIKPGINLYKLHGSVNWSTAYTYETSPSGPRIVDWSLAEIYPPDWAKGSDMVLGPGAKLQFDEPYVTLYAEFHRALERAENCVAIGHSFGDKHIREPVETASRRGMKVIDVRPNAAPGLFARHTPIRSGARAALEDGLIARALSS